MLTEFYVTKNDTYSHQMNFCRIVYRELVEVEDCADQASMIERLKDLFLPQNLRLPQREVFQLFAKLGALNESSFLSLWQSLQYLQRNLNFQMGSTENLHSEEGIRMVRNTPFPFIELGGKVVYIDDNVAYLVPENAGISGLIISAWKE